MNPQTICGRLNDTISKLTAVSDFIKRIGDESFLLEEQTPLGLHLFIGDCIENLKEVEQHIERP
jgi:hypothetical protein